MSASYSFLARHRKSPGLLPRDSLTTVVRPNPSVHWPRTFEHGRYGRTSTTSTPHQRPERPITKIETVELGRPSGSTIQAHGRVPTALHPPRRPVPSWVVGGPSALRMSGRHAFLWGPCAGLLGRHDRRLLFGGGGFDRDRPPARLSPGEQSHVLIHHGHSLLSVHNRPDTD